MTSALLTPVKWSFDKRRIYACAGVSEYWVFDLERNKLRVFCDLADFEESVDYQSDTVWQDDTISIQAFPKVILSAIEMKRLI
ncbi:MAG: Uma2 family endonuclease [Cyanobacteria bacterium P01_H01_bin.119]